jgi:4-amino-4-deoxy-L-arabinose transferase-like glycosyltransferase
LLVVTLGSTISGLGVLFVWGFARRLFGQKTAQWAAWGLSLYPEAVLLGSSQMREAFTIPLSAALAYFLLCYWQDRQRRDLLAFFILAAVTAVISWAYLVLLFVVFFFLLVGLFLENRELAKFTLPQNLGLAAVGASLAVGAAYFWRVLSRMNDFQGYLTESASGVMQAVFSRLPEFLHIPFMVGYGVLRPLLPAAILEQGDSVLWRWVGIWRSVGWTMLLALLVLVTIQVLRKHLWLKPVGMLVISNWLMALVSAYRAGGDMWDNPRYRAGFSVFQIVLAVWAFLQQRRDRDPIFRRLLIFIFIQMVWLFIWYIPRYVAVPWEVGRVENRLLAGLGCGIVYWLWDWYRSR